MNTVARYMKEIDKNVKVENLPAADLDHPLCKIFMNIREKNGQEYEPDSRPSLVFSEASKDI